MNDPNLPETKWFDSHTHNWVPVGELSTPRPDPGTLEYYRMGCDELYTDLGGEG